MDDITKLKELCNKYNIWLHLSGDNLSGLALAKSNSDVCSYNNISNNSNNISNIYYFQSPNIADSMTLTPSIWLNISALPVVVSFIKINLICTLYTLAESTCN